MKKRTTTLSIFVAVLLVAITLVGCGGSTTPSITPSELLTKVETVTKLPNMQLISSDDLTSLYGISLADVKDFSGKIDSTGLNANEIIIIKATDTAAADRIDTKLKDRLTAKANEAQNYSPDLYALINKCSVVEKGDYVALLVCDQGSAMNQVFSDNT